MASARLKHWTKSDADLIILRRQFKKTNFPNSDVKLRLANKFKVTPDQVGNWFRTERSREYGSRGKEPQRTRGKGQEDLLRPQSNGILHENNLAAPNPTLLGQSSLVPLDLLLQSAQNPFLEPTPQSGRHAQIKDEDAILIQTENGFVDVRPKPSTLQSMIARKRAKLDAIHLRIDAYSEEIGRIRAERTQLAEKIAELLDAERQAEAGCKLVEEELEEINQDLQDIGA